MSWSLIIAKLIELLLPYLAEWFRDLLERLDPAAELGDPTLIDPPAAMARLFEMARAETWWWQFGRRAAIATAGRVAIRRAPELFAAARHGDPAPVLSRAEVKSLEAL